MILPPPTVAPGYADDLITQVVKAAPVDHLTQESPDPDKGVVLVAAMAQELPTEVA
ncbi:hypothetical protein JOF53_005505 [Crossiella equi]|uniref:Uncharacterized protein n=1 Tax=Crossiella equi TaxID=130796 RepID=A0ABS5AJ77_9PSEU|nr:hypothetical protein [Crossiella equi]MBP2476633.1 hypothetical protein [Crossiella equi]